MTRAARQHREPNGQAGPSMDAHSFELINGRIWLGGDAPDRADECTALALHGGRVVAVGDAASIAGKAGPSASRIDLGGRRVIPGLIDSHIHALRGGLTYLDELDWTMYRDLDHAINSVRLAASSRPTGEWITALGGWHPTQFSQNRMPTMTDLDRVAPQHPVFVHPLYGHDDFGVLNSKALEALGWVERCADPEGGHLHRDDDGRPDGRLSGLAAYQHINRVIIAPPLPRAIDSTVAFLERLASLGITGIIDAAGLGMRPDRYHAVRAARAQGRLPIRVRLNLCATTDGGEEGELAAWREFLDPGFGDEWLSVLGLGELLVFGAHDWEGMAPFEVSEEAYRQLVEVFRAGARSGWPHTVHAILDSSISRILDALEEVNREIPISPLRWNICHAECLTKRNVARVAALGIGVAIQSRLMHKAAVCADRWGEDFVVNGPPIGDLVRAGVPIGAGTDSTRGASYNPWHALTWLITGVPIDGGPHRGAEHLLTRAAALNAYSRGSAWFSFEDDDRGHLNPGARADLAVLSQDIFEVDAADIPGLTSDMTMCGGYVVHRSAAFAGTVTRATPYPIRRQGTQRQSGRMADASLQGVHE